MVIKLFLAFLFSSIIGADAIVELTVKTKEGEGSAFIIHLSANKA